MQFRDEVDTCWRSSDVRWFVRGLLLLLGASLLSSTAHAQTFADPRFGAETVVALPPFTPVGITFAPDGRMFIWQKNGIVRVY
jgi:hypothetical protein